ncbi:hypothetical protein CALCODRAFT_201733 [Calocera cornea HHB12733]|uniref:Uncharacterized protein n=1 Tax=Calocera cornea HHB12733 TaxID=1353952 RepID=A0A165C3W2_9BASI|nr:hypothetical protein CALCODRAFT_201733 [Calocera cornea HHB12733]
MRTAEVHAFDRTERRREWTAEGQIAQRTARVRKIEAVMRPEECDDRLDMICPGIQTCPELRRPADKYAGDRIRTNAHYRLAPEQAKEG